MRPKSKNAFRQETNEKTHTTSNGVKAPPQRALIHMIPCARTRSTTGSQIVKALVRFGKHPASPAPNMKRAKEFVAFMLDEKNLTPYVEGALGRWFPVQQAATKSPFWQADVHRRAVHAQFSAGTVPFEFTKNYKFTILNNENVWAKAASRVINDKIPVPQAVDEMIARIKAVAG